MNEHRDGDPEGRGTPQRRLPLEELVDLTALERAKGAPLTPAELRRALPRGWALEDDLRHAHRDLRLFFREGWILAVGLLAFGSVGLAFLWGAMPRGWRGFGRLAALVLVLVLLGGFVGPWITRTLNRRA